MSYPNPDSAMDLGHGVRAWWTAWAPDRDLNPQYAGIPDVPRYGMIYEHPASLGVCFGGITLDTPETAAVRPPGRPVWQVVTWEPLTLAPSLLCTACGHHGWIREGVWVPC